jgi:hypothetical protein
MQPTMVRRTGGADLTTAIGISSCSMTTSAQARTRARTEPRSLAASTSDTRINVLLLLSVSPLRQIVLAARGLPERAGPDATSATALRMPLSDLE